MSFIAAIAGFSLAVQSSGSILGIPFLNPAPTSETTIAKLNGLEIKAKDIQDLLWDARADEILSEVIYFQLAKQEGDKLGVFLTGKEIDEGVAREYDAMKQSLQPGQTIEQFMAAQGQTKARLYLAVKTSLLLTKIAFADFNPELYVKVSTIIVKPASASTNDVLAAIKIADQAYARLKKGDSWESVVDDVVTDEAGRQSRGRLGWRQIAAFPDDVKAELPSLKSGDISKPVQTPNGIQLFRIDAVGKGQSKEALEQMRIDLTESLRMQAVNKIRRNIQIERTWPPKPKQPGG